MKTGHYRGLRAGAGVLSGRAPAPDGAGAGGNDPSVEEWRAAWRRPIVSGEVP